jgi:hypothetical protein
MELYMIFNLATGSDIIARIARPDMQEVMQSI